MLEQEKAAVFQCWKKLQTSLDVHNVNNYLLAHSVFNFTDYQLVNNAATDERGRIQLMQIVINKQNGWQILLNALGDSGQKFLANDLVAALSRGSTSGTTEENDDGHNEQKQNQKSKLADNPDQKSRQKTEKELLILEAMDPMIKLTAQRRILQKQPEHVIPILNASEAVEAAKIRGISPQQYHAIKSEKNSYRAAQMFYEALIKIESGYSILIAHLKGSGNPTLAQFLEETCKREIETIIDQIEIFTAHGEVEEIEINKRNELIRILSIKFKVKEDDRRRAMIVKQ